MNDQAGGCFQVFSWAPAFFFHSQCRLEDLFLPFFKSARFSFTDPENLFSNNFRWQLSEMWVKCPNVSDNPNTPHQNTKLMKLYLSAICASLMIAPLSFASDCGKCKKDDGCGKEKKEETILLSDCGKCKKDADKEKETKKEGTVLADCGKCKKDADKEKEKAKEGTLASDCGKCKKDGDKEKKEEGTLASDCGKCKKDCDKEKKEEGTLV